jgi:hypothetical protein
MSISQGDANMEITHSQNSAIFQGISRISRIRLPGRKITLGALIVGATLMFEAFNYSTTEHALTVAFGTLGFVGIPLATILALAFCGIDFAGIARLFSPEEREDAGRMEGIYLLAAWMLAGFMNAAMTWWSVTEALMDGPAAGNMLMSREDLILYVPILVAGAVWLIRILLIGMLTMTGKDALTGGRKPAARKPAPLRPIAVPSPSVQANVRPFTGGRS